MKTKKLYDDNAYIKEFCANVLSCEKSGENYAVILQQTAFFPEAGGQPSDKGTIDGEAVLDVQIENDEILHFVKNPIDTGKEVKGVLDFSRRFSFMQNHTGEHILSGCCNKLYGFDNVGFHLNEELITLDFDGVLSGEQISELEYFANKKVFENNKVNCYYPRESELKNINYRSKKELLGDIRIVEIENTDICACCAPHVAYTGEVGIIKVLSSEKMRGGTRLFVKCGELAFLDYKNKTDNILKIQNLLSCKAENVAESVYSLNEKAEAQKYENTRLKEKLISFMAYEVEDFTKPVFVEDFDSKLLINFADLLHKKSGKTVSVFTNKDKASFLFAICGEDTQTKEFYDNIKTKLQFRGGGRNGLITGTVLATKEEIKKIWE